jgi:FkbM family methyltransferase
MEKLYHQYFETIEAHLINGRKVLDFSAPGEHRYRNSGVTFVFPSIPEDDSIAAYTRKYIPKPGDIVWDVGAHAGSTTYFLSQLVGPTGTVVAFEPDDCAHEYLVGNIERHRLDNVVVVRKALCARIGQVTFNMSGTMAAGIRDYVVYSEECHLKTVPAVTIERACEELGQIPSYIKMDIEGAEVAAIQGSADFLRSHPIHFAIETEHVVNGEVTCHALERIFTHIGYRVESQKIEGVTFTWAAGLEQSPTPKYDRDKS